MVRPIVIAAGGTGGHFFPAEALAAALMKRGERVVLLTDARSGGLNSAVFANAERHVLAGAGLSGRGPVRVLQGVIALAKGFFQARKLLADLQPAAVVAFGGYPAVAPVLAARVCRHRPAILLHEQNAVLGRANRLLARFAGTLVLSFAQTEKLPAGVKTIVLGNPVRPAIAALAGEPYAPPAQKIELLVLGGSLGARVFSTLLPEALALLPDAMRECLNVVQQCRVDGVAAAQAVYAQAGIAAELSPFFHDVAERIAKSHLIVARAGASTVAELAVAGRPAIFIPLPGAIDNHQRANADALAQAGAAWRLDQAGLTPRLLADRIETLLAKPDDLITAAAAADKIGRPHAAEQLADCVKRALAQVPA